MNLLKKTALAVMLLLLFVIGIYALSPYPYFPRVIKVFLNRMFYFFLWSQGWKIFFWIVVTILPVLYLISVLKQCSTREKYVIRGKQGDSSISEAAIEKSLISAVRTVPTVVKVKPLIRNERGGLKVTILTKISLEQFVPNICERIRYRARTTLTDVLGIDRVAPIDVEIEDVKLPHPPLAERIRKSGEKKAAPVDKQPEKPVQKPLAKPPEKPAAPPAKPKPAVPPKPSLESKYPYSPKTPYEPKPAPKPAPDPFDFKSSSKPFTPPPEKPLGESPDQK